jgi:transcriptional regulator of acetoin/glycerol metabolism
MHIELPTPVLARSQERPGAPAGPGLLDARPGRDLLSYPELQKLERENLLEALRRTNWKVSGPSGAAELLGINRTTLASRIKAMEIRRPV